MDFYESLTHFDQSLVEELKAAQNLDPVHALLLNHHKISDEPFTKAFPHVKSHPFIPHVYYYDKNEYDFGKTWLYDAGVISIQDPAAMVAPFLLNPKPKERVLDLCAAPGGKTIFSSLLMEQEGVIVSNDISYPRAKNLSQNIERMGLSNCIVTSDDFEPIYTRFAGFFDKILLDAPCSGSAMFRKDLAELHDWSKEKVLRCAAIQSRLLEIAYTCLKKGGKLLYSTCSFSKEENEDQILAFLKGHEDMKVCKVEERTGYFHPESLKESIYLFPHLYQGEGQFVVLLEKEGEEKASFNPKRKPVKIDSVLATLIQEVGIKEEDIVLRNGVYSSIKEKMDVSPLHLLRYGVELGIEDKRFIPSHAFARAYPSSCCIPLNSTQVKAYLNGETFTLKCKDGYHVVSFASCPLGWVKVSGEVAKNHYPKGLRYRYKEDLFTPFEGELL